MVTITVTRDGETSTLVWTDGELAGDEPAFGIIEALEAAGTEVLVTPVGPLMAVDRAEPRTILAALEEFGPVAFSGTLPVPTWETDETRGLDLTF